MIGLGRSYFYRRLHADMQQLLERKRYSEGLPEEMLIKVNLEEAAQQLKYCPCCGSELEGSAADRLCECGGFVVTDVWSDGAVVFSFTMNPVSEVAAPAEQEVGRVDGSEDTPSA